MIYYFLNLLFFSTKMKLTLAILLVGCALRIKGGTYTNRFLEQYKKIKDIKNGYFSEDGVPYHSVETLMVDAPDHGHESTSEAFSYLIYLEAMYGAITNEFKNFNDAWQLSEDHLVPKLQTTNNFYQMWKPGTYEPELDTPDQYPSPLDFGVPVGHDPIADELSNTYGSKDIYGWHWLLDVDNVYGFGNAQGQCCVGPTESGPSLINTFQRGPMESTWKTIPQPTCDNFRYGGQHGFLDLFVKDNNYVQQWKYSNAPDADARAVQASYWASEWAKKAGKTAQITGSLSKASKLGDYLRYALFDKYFKKIGNCIGPYGCQGANGKDSAHYLISWYYAWGGSLSPNGGWAWRIGDGSAHIGYQNPMTAYALSSYAPLKPRSATGSDDWKVSLERMLEFYEWLQTSEGAFAGGVANSWKGRYETPPSNLTKNTFHGMFYDWEPVYHNPPSNRWYGFQVWTADRLAQYYYITGNEKAKRVLDKWISWVLREIKFNGNSYQLPDHLNWIGAPPDVHVKVETYSNDVGPASGTARTLSYYAAKSNNNTVKAIAKKLLDAIWQHQTNIGVSVEESLEAYKQFDTDVYVPPGWRGTYPNGDVIDSTATFISLRSWYKKDKNYPIVEKFLKGGAVPKLVYHRFWTQADVALAQGAYGLLFNE